MYTKSGENDKIVLFKTNKNGWIPRLFALHDGCSVVLFMKFYD